MVVEMIKIDIQDDLLRRNAGKDWLDIYSEYSEADKSKPYMSSNEIAPNNKEAYFTLSDRFHQWFIDFNIRYELRFLSYYETRFMFEKASDAMLFKLRWL